ncbi:MAG: riboflavin biosynthesis protein RibF [Ligilactobacillus sp.]|nr:riboflavin biosynthesis protein RibF [Ligilactobacillus sp.]
MKVIELAEPYAKSEIYPEKIVLALGFFDGVHRGHQAVIKAAKKQAQKMGVKLAVMTFDRHPSAIFQQRDPQKIQYLTTIAEKLALFEKFGADIAYVVKFDEKLAYLKPQEFIDKYVVGLNAIGITAGSDYTYGPHTVANMKNLPKYAKNRFEIQTVELLKEDEKVGSTEIRKALASGKVERAAHYLGYDYQTTGTVVHGFERGRQIGFPTLNIEASPAKQLPAVGVYAVEVELDGKRYQGMASIGHNETFGDDLAKTLEVNLFDFSAMVYGKKVTVYWKNYLRPMVKFNSIAELVAQLEADKQHSEALLNVQNEN